MMEDKMWKDWEIDLVLHFKQGVGVSSLVEAYYGKFDPDINMHTQVEKIIRDWMNK